MLGVQEAIAVASWTPPKQRSRVRLRGGSEGRRAAVCSTGSIGHGQLEVFLLEGLVVDNVWGDGFHLAGPLFVPDVGRRRTSHRQRGQRPRYRCWQAKPLEHCWLLPSLLDAFARCLNLLSVQRILSNLT